MTRVNEEATRPQHPDTRSVAARFDPRRNSLNAIRLILAICVIVSHAWPIAGYGDEPTFGGVTPGGWGVYGFFAISGYLITASRMSHGLARYFWDRFLRIYPGFFVAMLVTAFIFAPLSLLVTNGKSYPVRDALSYLAHDLPLYPPRLEQTSIGTTLDGTPYFPTWNGPVYTLFYEALCYIAVAVLVAVVAQRALPVVMVACTLGLGLAAYASDRGAAFPSEVKTALPMATAFTFGAALYLYREQVPLTRVTALVCAVAFVGLLITGAARPFWIYPYTILLFWLGSTLPFTWITTNRDISYGVYLYGWPVQMLVYLAGLHWRHRPTVGLNIVLVVLIAGALAVVSAVLVEVPARRLRRLVRDPVATA